MVAGRALGYRRTMSLRSASIGLSFLVLGACVGDDTWPNDSGLSGDTDVDGVDCAARADISQGVAGRVTWREGDWTPGGQSGMGDWWPLQTTVGAFPPVDSDDARSDNSDPDAYGRYSFPTAGPIGTATSDADGCFAIEVEGGDYTVAARDGEAWYCNASTSEVLCPVTVAWDHVTQFDVVIDYDAAY